MIMTTAKVPADLPSIEFFRDLQRSPDLQTSKKHVRPPELLKDDEYELTAMAQ